ncbi:hypothetical protein, partial [Actinomadura sp. HBU206391]|uniref:hypothetical protein n=1 Tax=Actinomadura sp. HBU206391 TaxID=2731692 RepID=UPI001D894BDA|nr:hypothetical protein [Actinomadura sp. HBU206391]
MIGTDVANANDPLAGLDNVRWDLAWDCNRDVDQVPILLRLLWQGDRDAVGQLRDRLALLSPIGEHVSPATSVAVPFLRRLALHPHTRDRVAVVALLIRITQHAIEWRPATLYGKDMTHVGEECRKALRVHPASWFDMLEHPDRSLRRHVLVLLVLVSQSIKTDVRMWDLLLDADSRDLLAERAVALAYKQARYDWRLRGRLEDWLLNGPGLVECDEVEAAWDYLIAPDPDHFWGMHRIPYWIDEGDVAAARALMEEA